MHSPCLLHKCQKMVMSQWISGLIINLLEFSLWPNCSIYFYFFFLLVCGILFVPQIKLCVCVYVCTVHTRMYLDSHCNFYAMELFTLSMTEQTDDSAFCSPLGSVWQQPRKNCALLPAFCMTALMKYSPSKKSADTFNSPSLCYAAIDSELYISNLVVWAGMGEFCCVSTVPPSNTWPLWTWAPVLLIEGS